MACQENTGKSTRITTIPTNTDILHTSTDRVKESIEGRKTEGRDTKRKEGEDERVTGYHEREVTLSGPSHISAGEATVVLQLEVNWHSF